MKRFKLNSEYEWQNENDYIEISESVSNAIDSSNRDVNNQYAKIKYHKAYYSLDAGDGIEKDILFVSATPEEIYEKKLTQEQLYAALNQLPKAQLKRIYAKYFQGMTTTQIAKIEGVDESAVRHSIERALKKLRKILENF